MPRGTKCRLVEIMPAVRVFKPAGLPRDCLEEVTLKVEEVEAVRLKDYVGLEQEECADRMQVSRPTFQRILGEAHAKIADALVNGKAIRIGGGNYCFGRGYCRRLGRQLQSEEECPYMDEPVIMDQAVKKEEGPLRKVAVCASESNPEAMVDGRFGRCRYFLIMDIEGGAFTAVDNAQAQANHGAGTGSAQAVINNRVEAVIASRIGPKAFALLQRAGIPVYQAVEGESAAQNMQYYVQGMLARLEHANN